MENNREEVCRLAVQVACLLEQQPRQVAIDVIDVARILFRPPVTGSLGSPEMSSPEGSEVALQSL